MEISLELLVPRDARLNEVAFETRSFEWQGVTYPQGMPEFKFGQHFKLVVTPAPQHLQHFLPSEMMEIGWQCLSVKGDGLNSILRCNAEPGVECPNAELEKLIKLIFAQTNSWAVILEVNFEPVRNRIECALSDVMQLINSALLTGEGLVAIHDER